MKTKNANALIAVLGLIFAASIIAVSLVEYTTRAVRVSASSTWERDLRLDAYSALYASVAVLKEYEKIDGGLFSAEQGWGEPLKDGRITFPDGSLVTVKITDEAENCPCRLSILRPCKRFLKKWIFPQATRRKWPTA